MVTKDRQIKTMAKLVPGRKQGHRINTDVGKKKTMKWKEYWQGVFCSCWMKLPWGT